MPDRAFPPESASVAGLAFAGRHAPAPIRSGPDPDRGGRRGATWHATARSAPRRSRAAKLTPTEGKGRVRRGRPKVCLFCAERSDWVDYKDINVLRRFVNDRGRIRARGATGTCTQHQRDVAVAIKTARELALLPYSVRTLAPGAGDRRGGPRRESAPAAAAAEAAAPATEDLDDPATDEADDAPAPEES